MNATPTPSRDIQEIHERAIDRLARVIFTTRHFCGDEQSAISDFLKEEEETEEIRFTALERAAITFQATLRAYGWEGKEHCHRCGAWCSPVRFFPWGKSDFLTIEEIQAGPFVSIIDSELPAKERRRYRAIDHPVFVCAPCHDFLSTPACAEFRGPRF